MKTVEKIIWVIALIAIVVLIGVVGYGYYQKATYKTQNPLVTMEVENFGTIKMELYPDQAPEAYSKCLGTGLNRDLLMWDTYSRKGIVMETQIYKEYVITVCRMIESM